MGTGTQAEKVAVLPVIEVMAGAVAALGIGRNLVLGVAAGGQPLQPGLLNRPENVFLGQRGRARVEHGVGFQRQLIPGQVLGCERHGLIQIGHRLGVLLIRQAVHQVEVQVVEAGAARHLDRTEGFAVVMDAAKGLEMAGIEALDANRQAIDARQPVVAKLGLLEGAGVGFEGDFDFIGERHALVQRLQKAVQGRS